MTRPDAPNLATLLESFFREHLPRVRGASPHTLRAYRDAVRLFLLFLADRVRREVDGVRLDDLHAEHDLAFLDHLETRRGNDPTTRNSGLAALLAARFAGHRQDAPPPQDTRIRRLPEGDRAMEDALSG